MGSRPVAGRPRFFGLALIDIREYWFSLKASRGEASTSAPALTQAMKGLNSMTRADSVHSTPFTNTSVDPTRRRFLSTAAGGAATALGAGATLDAAAIIVTRPASAVGLGEDRRSSRWENESTRCSPRTGMLPPATARLAPMRKQAVRPSRKSSWAKLAMGWALVG